MQSLLNTPVPASQLSFLSLRDNLIRDDPAGDTLAVAIQGNATLTRVLIDMNPIKHATVKEIEQSVKRNAMRLKEREGPMRQREIKTL